MTGQRLEDVTGCVVLAQDKFGKQTGWHVFNVREMSWEFDGIGARGTEATVTISGSFFRLDKSATTEALEMTPLEIGESE